MLHLNPVLFYTFPQNYYFPSPYPLHLGEGHNKIIIKLRDLNVAKIRGATVDIAFSQQRKMFLREKVEYRRSSRSGAAYQAPCPRFSFPWGCS